jgi:hypothetical protein
VGQARRLTQQIRDYSAQGALEYSGYDAQVAAGELSGTLALSAV